jgi:hypothetical protein
MRKQATKSNHETAAYNFTEYGKNRGGFIEKDQNLGVEILKYGDASLRFVTLTRIPVTLKFRPEEGFPARLNLQFDSTCEMQLSKYNIWSIAMMSELIML